MPGGHIFNKDGTRMIKVRSTPQTPSLETPPSHDTHSNGLPSEAVAGPNTSNSGSKKKKKKNRNKGAAATLDPHLDPSNHHHHHHHHHPHDNHDHFEPSVQGPSNNISHPQAGPNTSRQHLQEYYDAIRASLEQFDSNEYFDGEGDDPYYSDEDPHFDPTEPSYDGASDQRPGELEVPISKKSKKKKKKKGAGGQAVAPSEGSQGPSHETPRKDAQKSSKDRIWNTSTSEERERIKNFWLSLGEDERRSLVKVEKEAVLKKMKEQQKHSCSCSVCGRKRTAIEEELEVLYDAYYEELEHPSKGLPQARRVEELPELEDDDEGPYDDDEDYEDISEDGHRSVQQDFFNFGNSLTVRGGILTVADDLLKNDGKKFIEMMEQLAERRMAREEEATAHAQGISHGINNQMHSGMQHNHTHVPNGNQEYDVEEDEEEFDEDDEDFDEEDDEEPDAMTEEQRMEEGRRMFQIFAARMFEQRVLSAYRERVAVERQKKLLEEVEDEKRKEEEQKERKLREKEKKSAKRKAQKEAKEAELREKAEKKAKEEAEKKAEEERKAEEARKRKEELRLKREAEKKAAEEERLRKEEERKKRVQEEREREHERERKRKEQLEQEKKKKAEVARKQKEEKDQRDKEKKEKDEKDRKDRENRKKVAEADKERAKKEAEGNVAIPKIATTPILSSATKVATTPSHTLHPPTIVPAVVSPRLAVAAPALPKTASPGKAKSSARGSVASSPQTPKIQTRANLGASAGLSQQPTSATVSTSSTPSLASIPPAGPIGPPKSSQMQSGPPGIPPITTAPPPGLSPQGAVPNHHIPPIGAPHGFPSHISPPPGVPPPEGFGIHPGQGAFLPPPGHRPHQLPLSMLPAPGFGMNIFRGFPGPPVNPPMPLGPPSAGLRGFPPPTTRSPFATGDFNTHPQPLSAPGFPQAPGSPFMRHENHPTGHQRQGSGEHIEGISVSTPKPIHRPTPIQRPTNAAPGGPVSKINIDELSTSLGSSALLGDDEPEEPLVNKMDNASPARRGSNIPGGMGVFGMIPSNSPFFMHDTASQPFGSYPSPSNTWGAPSPLFNPTGPWGPPALSPAAPSGWIPNATTPFGANSRRPGRLDVLRHLAISICKQIPNEKKNPDGYMPLKLLLKHVNESPDVNPPHEVSEEEITTVLEIEGDWQNGGGNFQRMYDDNGTHVRFQVESEEAARRRVSSSAGLVGVPIGGPGDIGSPIVSSATSSLPFANRPGST